MFDVFYLDKKPNLFAHEQQVDSFQHAQQLSRTVYFWIVNYLLDYTGFDFLFQPKPWQNKYTHVWPSQHHKFSGTCLGSIHGNETDYHFVEQIIPLCNTLDNYQVLNTSAAFDFSWKPHPHDTPYIYVFGNQWWPANKMPTIEYHVPGATELKYMEQPQARLPPQHDYHWHTLVDCKWDYSWTPDPGDPPMIYVFGNQWHLAEKMPTVTYSAPGATQYKYMSWPRAKVMPNTARWTVPNTIDPDTVDYSWIPDPGDPPMIYQFATQHQKTGGPIYTSPGATEIKYLAELKIHTAGKATAIYEIDHLDGNAGQVPNTAKRVRYFDNYRDTLVRIAKSIDIQHEYVWICSSICDYTDFDFSWHPEDWQATMLHVFASDGNKFGDTFFMHVPSFAANAEKKALLEWYDVNFIQTSVTRRSLPVIRHTNDSQVAAIKTSTWPGPLAVFAAHLHPIDTVPCVALWREQTKTVVPLSASGATVIVPRVAIPYIKEQLYDYPYIDKTHKTMPDCALDIVFISNGESNANCNWDRLNQVQQNKLNRVIRVDGVNGRVAAYQAAANASNTDWFFAVFAKLAVDSSFDWNWQPDMLQQAKHYIFHAQNPCNGLVYGHQAAIAYNKRLVLANTGTGLDFTMDQLHEVVPVLSGTAHYSETPWMAWRTAFREVLKLRQSLPDVENEYRLNKWLDADGTASEPANSNWSRFGAQDAMEYYTKVRGEFTHLKKSYEWDWLASYAFIKRSLIPE